MTEGSPGTGVGIADPEPATPTPRRRGRARLVAALAAVAIVAIVAGGFAATRLLPRTPSEALAAPRFVDETVAAGVAHTYDGSVASFSTGGGVAAFDCDADGRPDLYFAGGERPAALFRNASPVGGQLRFEAVHDPATDLTGVLGAYPVDIDGDGTTDLAVLRLGGVVLLRGTGGCRFETGDRTWGFEGATGMASAFSATWEDEHGLPTLAVGRYLTLDASGKPTLDCDTNQLFRFAAGGGYLAPISLAPGYCTLSMLFSDWDRSGRRDLRVSNDAHYYPPAEGEEQLWRMERGAPPRLYTADDGWVRVQVEGMGIASRDLTGDGYPEVFLTSQVASRLQTLTAGPAQPTYRDIGLKRGVNVDHPFTGDTDLPSTAWHPQFEDVNDDGFVDLFVSKGNVSDVPDFAMRDPSNLLLGQPDGTFREAAEAAGIVTFDRGRGAAVVDLNLDGLPDLVEMNYGAPVRVWRNVGSGTAEEPVAMGRWIALRVSQEGANRDAIGAWVEVKVGDLVQLRELTVGGGHAGGQLGWVGFGLGPADGADVRITWPDGTVGSWMHVAADAHYVIDRDAAGPRAWP